MTNDPGTNRPVPPGPVPPGPVPPGTVPPGPVPPPAYVPPAPAHVPAVPGRPATPPPEGLDEHGRVTGGRISALWVGIIVAAVLLIALLVFIGQNSHRVSVHFLGLHGQTSLAIGLVLSAVVGILVVAIPATARIVQLRRALKHNAANGVRGGRPRGRAV